MKRLSFVTFVCVAVAAVAPRRAVAHGVDEPPAAEAPLVVDGELIGAGANYGLLLREDSALLWTPEETLSTQSINDWHAVDGGDRILAATSRGLLSTTDGGCTWSIHGETLAGRAVTDVGSPLQDSRLLLAATEAGGDENGIFRSTDGGTSWMPTEVSGADLLMRSIVVRGTWAWAEGFDRGELEARLWWSKDGGETWTEAAEPVTNWSNARLLGADEEKVFVAKKIDDETWRLHGVSKRLESPEKLGTIPDRPEGMINSADGMYVLGGKSTYSVSKGTVTDLDFRGHCLGRHLDRGRAVACAAVVDAEGHFVEFDGSEKPKPLLSWKTVKPRDCPEGSEGAAQIEKLWPTLERQGVGGESDSRDTDDAASGEGCGCASEPEGAIPPLWALFGLSVAVASTRRRYDGRPSVTAAEGEPPDAGDQEPE